MPAFLHSQIHSFPRTRRFVSVDWVACGTCYTKAEDTELGGIEGAETGFSQES